MTGLNGMDQWDTFHVELEVPIVAPPERVFDALTRNISAWWGEPHLLGKAVDIVLEPFVGGRLYEVWKGEGTGALWATVTKIQPPRELRLVGPIGLPEPAHAVTTFLLVPKGETTVVQFTHEAFGKIAAKTRSGYTAGWKEMLEQRLPSFVEKGLRPGLNKGTLKE